MIPFSEGWGWQDTIVTVPIPISMEDLRENLFWKINWYRRFEGKIRHQNWDVHTDQNIFKKSFPPSLTAFTHSDFHEAGFRSLLMIFELEIRLYLFTSYKGLICCRVFSKIVNSSNQDKKQCDRWYIFPTNSPPNPRSAACHVFDIVSKSKI
jgi:hypothetical protein